MQGDQKFEIEDNLKQVAEMGIFGKYFLPYIVHIILGLIFILSAVLLVPFLVTFFPDIDIKQIGTGIFTILVLILVLAVGNK